MRRREFSDYRWYAIGFALRLMRDIAFEDRLDSLFAGDIVNANANAELYDYFRRMLMEHRRKIRQTRCFNIDSTACYMGDGGLMSAFATIRRAIDEGLLEPIPGLKLVKGPGWPSVLQTKKYLDDMEGLLRSFNVYPGVDLPVWIHPKLRELTKLDDFSDMTPVADAIRLSRYDNGCRIAHKPGTFSKMYAPRHDGRVKLVKMSSGQLPDQHNREMHGRAFVAVASGVASVEWFNVLPWQPQSARFYVTDFHPCETEFVDGV